MKKEFLIGMVLCLVLSVVIFGCAGSAPTMGDSEEYDPGKCYVYGKFVKTGGIQKIAVRLTNLSTENKYNIMFESESDGITLIAIEPGEYSLTEIVFMYKMFNEIANKQDITDEKINKPFIVSAGNCYYLGSWEGRTSGNKEWTVDNFKDNYGQDTKALKEKFSSFINVETVNIFE